MFVTCYNEKVTYLISKSRTFLFFFLVDPGFTPEVGPGVIQIMTYTEKCKMDHK